MSSRPDPIGAASPRSALTGFPDATHVTPSDPVVRRNATEGPGLVLGRHPEGSIIDEVQYAPDILPYTNMRIHRHISNTGVFFLTGSEVSPLMQGFSESLAGSAAIFGLQGLSFDEYPGKGNNVSEPARDAGVSQLTAHRWISILETTRVLYLLRPFHRNVTKRTTKASKVYLTDAGPLSYLLRYPDWSAPPSGPQAGAVFENYAVIGLLKEKLNHNHPYELLFYRVSNQNEIDIVVGRRRDPPLRAQACKDGRQESLRDTDSAEGAFSGAESLPGQHVPEPRGARADGRERVLLRVCGPRARRRHAESSASAGTVPPSP